MPRKSVQQTISDRSDVQSHSRRSNPDAVISASLHDSRTASGISDFETRKASTARTRPVVRDRYVKIDAEPSEIDQAIRDKENLRRTISLWIIGTLCLILILSTVLPFLWPGTAVEFLNKPLEIIEKLALLILGFYLGKVNA